MMREDIPQAERIPTLRAAITGDYGAQQTLLDCFDSYINTMSIITIYAQGGEARMYLDEDFKIQIQCKLLKSLDHFDLDGILSKNSMHRNANTKITKEA